jgi:hypothetical protein
MLQAMLHGKLTREEEGMEDLLTSNVFGLIRYLSAEEILFPFLSLAWNPFTGQSIGDWLQDATLVEYMKFWSTLSAHGCKECEPDIDVLIRNQDGNKT